METSVPSVLAVLVVKDGADWLRRVLASLARQTHARLGVVAVDNASTDGSAEILREVLGRKRVITMPENRGFGAALRRALTIPAAREADYVFLLHDDTLLSPVTVGRLVEEAGRIQGIGVIAPKVLDWEQPQVLREVGFATDRFGYPYSPLEDGEIDQGQYDAPREVLFVSSAAMLVSREAWTGAGLHDERLLAGDGDLDFCWRVRLAGFRVLVTPRAVVLHRSSGEIGERLDSSPPGERYRSERAGLMSLLKNYRLITLLWVLPLYAVQGLVRLVLYVVSRRFDRAGQILRAWGWNLIHFPGTIRRRIRVQAAREIPDREVTRFMSPAGTRLSRWAQQTSSLLVGRQEATGATGEEPETKPIGRRVASLLADHPVAVAWVAATALTLIAFRDVLFVTRIEGGAFPVFPDSWADFFSTFVQGWRTTGFGGPEGASPALVPLGAGSFLALGDPDLLGRLLVALAPVLAGVTCFLAMRRSGIPRLPAVTGAACYGLSALTMWAASEGRISTQLLLVALPWLWARLIEAFGPGGPPRPWRWAVGTGMGLALVTAFFPTAWVAVATVTVPAVMLPPRRGNPARGIALTAVVGVVAAALVFPLTAVLLGEGGAAAVQGVGRADFASLLRLSPGPAPGAWIVALFLPLAAVLSLAVIEGEAWRLGWRTALGAAGALLLSWLAAAGWLPPPVANPVAFLAAAAFSLSVLVGLGTRSLLPGVRRAAFGARQLTAGALVAIVGLGLGLQAVQAAWGRWAVGENRLNPGWPVIASSDPGVPFRVLWLGASDGSRFPAPGGDPEGSVGTGGTSLAYGVTGRRGRSVMATGLPPLGPGYPHLERTIVAMLAGDVHHGGALLAPMGIRFLVGGEGRLPPMASARLAQQVDLNLIQRAGGLTIYRNARALPEAAAIPGTAALEAARSSSLLGPVAIDPAGASGLAPVHGPGWRGTVEGSEPGLVTAATTFSLDWQLEVDGQGSVGPFPAFGWALGFEGPPGATVDVTFNGQTRRTVEVVILGVLWAGALWVVRRRARDELPLRAHAARSARRETPRTPEPIPG
jgi:GT2 family glycosyltransferase